MMALPLLVGWVSTVVALRMPGPGCDSIPGEWDWSTGGVITLNRDHSVLFNGKASGTWQCTDPRHDGVVVRWNTGFVDNMLFTGNRVSSRNNVGYQSSGTRASRPPSVASTPSPAPPPAGYGTAVVMASSPLKECLGIVPNAGRMARGPATEQYCRQLPGAAMYDQAGMLFKAGDHAGAARTLPKAAQAGNPLAQLRLAMMLENGDGVAADPRAALAWYTRAAALGEPASQAEMGGYYEEADGVPEDWDLAARLYRASAMQGWVKGQFALGRAYQFGIGVPQNRQEAVDWFQKSGAQGHAQGKYFAGWLRDPTNNIGFRTDAEHDLVIAGKLRFALGAGDPAGITFHTSAQRVAWLRGQGAAVDASEAVVRWQLLKDEYDGCIRNNGDTCRNPGPRPRN